MSKKLVAYFSVGGGTENVAKKLAKVTGADVYEIRPEAPYTQADLDWTDKSSRSTLEMQDKSSRPALADKDADIAGHDVIFLGFPIWWFSAPTIVNTFLESYDFSGKTVVPFATSDGSNSGEAFDRVAQSVGGSAKLIQGKLMENSFSDDELADWVKSLGL